MKLSILTLFLTTILTIEHAKAQDTIPPILICHDTLELVMPVRGQIELSTMDLIKEASDDQTPAQELNLFINNKAQNFVVTCDTFDCRGAADQVYINLQITCLDKAGNRSICNTLLIVRDELDVCNSHPTRINFAVHLFPDGPQLGGIPFLFIEKNRTRQYTTSWEFSTSILSDDCKITTGTLYPQTINRDSLAGVSTKDLIVLYWHLLGIKSLQHPYQYIAADINGDEQITAADVTLLRSVILGKREFTDLPYQSSWQVFLKEAPVDIDWTVWKDFVYSDITTRVDISRAFYAVKLGDVSMDYFP